MGGPSMPDAPDAVGAAREQAEFDRLAADTETWANRPDQYGPTGFTTWETEMIDSRTGRPIVQTGAGQGPHVGSGQWRFADTELGTDIARPEGYDDRYTHDTWDNQQWLARNWDENHHPEWQAYAAQQRAIDNESGGIEAVTGWTQNTQLNPEWQESLDAGRGLLNNQIDYRVGEQDRWRAEGPVNYGGAVGGGSIKPGQTIGTGDLAQFGQTSPNLGAQDWRQFGTTGQTVGADDYQQFGRTENTLGADDWRQFGTTESQIGGDDWRQFGTTDAQITGDDWRQFGNTEQTIGADDWQQYGNTGRTLTGDSYDARYGEANADPTGGYGSHGQTGSDWDQISYTPDAIRRQAEQETLAFMNSQLDPQWDTRQEQLEVQLANQGLQWGDAAYDNAMESMKNSRDQAYAGARNQALADSRSEANMLWGQEMQRSEQKNYQTQADLDNIYRARQSNIGNYQQNQSREQENYLAYQQAAFGQDLNARQQQLDSSLNFGREAWSQDFNNRQQQLNANLDYGREGFNQDLASRQQQIDANLDYGREGFQQDLQGRQQQINSDLAYGNAAFGQDLNSRQQQLDADLGYGREAFGQDLASRQQQLDANRNYSNDAFNQDLQARQANISNYLNYGREGFQQDLAGNQLNLQAMTEAERAQLARYQAANPNETAATINQIVG